ncbi:hypothetical protein ACHAXR_004072, partial [Thalassiosira sp. AJA248-18]
MSPPISPHESPEADASTLKKLVGVLCVSTCALLISTIVLATNQGSDAPATEMPADVSGMEEFSFLALKSESSFYDTLEHNVCAGAKLSFNNKLCVELEVAPQAGANVTKG